MKAAFLYNFAKFVEWPPEAFTDGKRPISICVLGKNPFGSLLSDAVEGKLVAGRRFTVSYVSTAAEARSCHVLFLSATQLRPVKVLLEEAKSPFQLTVGETSDFITAGGVIKFRVQDGRVRFEINLEAAAGGKFRISSKLLSLAVAD